MEKTWAVCGEAGKIGRQESGDGSEEEIFFSGIILFGNVVPCRIL